MFDLNTILSAALQQAVEAATKPLLERIETLQSTATGYEILFNHFKKRIDALEERATGGGLTRDEVREIANQAAADAISDHASEYDHDDFVSDLSSIDWSDYIDIDSAVRDAVNNLSFEISVN